MATQEQRRTTTRAAIVQAAQDLFGRRGFAATSIDDIAAQAGVSKGAVYHHLASKEALFEVVLEVVLADLAERVRRASLTSDDPLDRIRAGCRELLDACTQPAVHRIYLSDGPAVLGWHAWREADARYFISMVRAALAAAAEGGVIERQPVEPLAQLVGAAATEAAVMTARAGSADERQQVAAALDALLARLRCDESPGIGARARAPRP